MDKCIAPLEAILEITKSKEPVSLFFKITTSGSDKAFFKEAYNDGVTAVNHFKNIRHAIFKLSKVSGINVQIF